MCIKVWIRATNLKKTRNTEQLWEDRDSLLSNEVDFLLADIKTGKIKTKKTKPAKNNCWEYFGGAGAAASWV